MGRRIAAVLLGLLAGFVVVALIESISSVVYQPPTDLDFNDLDAMREFVATLPTGAFVFVLLAHLCGSFIAGFVCVLVAKERWNAGSLGLGVFFLLAGIANLVMIPHPMWFGVIDVLLYLPAAFAGGAVASGMLHTAEPKTTDAGSEKSPEEF